MWTLKKIIIIWSSILFFKSNAKLNNQGGLQQALQKIASRSVRSPQLDPDFLPGFSFGSLTGKCDPNSQFTKNCQIDQQDSSGGTKFVQGSQIGVQGTAGGDFYNQRSQIGTQIRQIGKGKFYNQGSQVGSTQIRAKRSPQFFNKESQVQDQIVFSGGWIDNEDSQVGSAAAAQGARVTNTKSQIGQQKAFGNDESLFAVEGSRFWNQRKKRAPQFFNSNSQIKDQIVFSGGSIDNEESQVGSAAAAQGARVTNTKSQIGQQKAFGNDESLFAVEGSRFWNQRKKRAPQFFNTESQIKCQITNCSDNDESQVGSAAAAQGGNDESLFTVEGYRFWN